MKATIFTKFCARSAAYILLIFMIAAAGCSDDDTSADESDTGVDATDTREDTDTGPDGIDRADLDLDEHLDAPGDGFVRAIQADDEEDLVDGKVAQGRPGDWLLENDHGRYLIGLGERAVGPCSWDGNPIETEAIIDGEPTGSVLGEICLLINVAQTFRPENAEILEDGTDGRAVVAVTGSVAPLDFLNIRVMMSDVVPGLYDMIHLDPDRTPPLTITVYYALTPESRSLRVITALRNDGDEPEYLNAAHLVLSGSTGSFFNPLSSRKGWGFDSLGTNNTDADPVSFLSYSSKDGGYTFVPDAQEHLEARLPVGGGMVGISGVIAVLHGETDLLSLVTATEAEMPDLDGYIGIDPDAIETVGYRLYPGDDSISSMTDFVFQDMGVETTEIRGQVVDHQGSPQPGVQITPLEEGDRSFTTVYTDDDGEFSMRLPHGQWEIRARDDGRFTQVFDIENSDGDVDLDPIEFPEPALVDITVRTPSGDLTPARVVVDCVSDCGNMRPDSREIDTSFRPPAGWLKLIEIGVEGTTSISLAEGDYRISVNRGMTFSTWPQDATDTGGELVSVSAGDHLEIDAEIAQVVDTTGTLSADFHIHAMASPDSSVSDRQRVLDFLAGGLDVMISSDHDAISDFQPTIDALGAADHITGVVGSEITSSNLGHLNAFPLQRDDDTRRGGTIDWSRGGGGQLTLQEVADAVREHPGEQVLQINHPRFPGGAIGLLKADVLTGQSFMDPELLHMPDPGIDEETGDTGLWTDDFDAIELYNGFSMSNFRSGLRWWLTMVGRGFSPTATAVSDTHSIYSSLSASPRSFVVVDEEFDTPSTIDLDHFIAQIKAGALVGTNGPMMHVELQNADGQTAGLGQTLDASGGEVTAHITLQMPDWIDVDTLDVYTNVPLEELEGEPGEAIQDPLEPTQRIAVDWNPEHRELVATGDLEHHRLHQTIEVPLVVTEDAYVVFIARGLNGRSMRPVLSSGTAPLAFSNPVFLDFDGEGYDNPHLQQARLDRLTSPRSTHLQSHRPQRLIIDHGDEITPENLGQFFDAMRCDHDHTEIDDHHDHLHEHGHPHEH